jgi:UDP-N-acetylmuramate--alanine ligase
MEGVTSQIILDKMALNNKRILSKESTMRWADASPLQVIITAGAGDIDTLIEPIKQILLKK